jgi:molybdopterin molybdotransferase
MNPLITPSEADALISDALTPLGTEVISAEQAAGRVLAQGLRADRPLPPFDRVMMDGIAFRAVEAIAAEGKLSLAGLHAAGDPTPEPLPPGACWEIMTGSTLPPDCDTIVPVEEVTTGPEYFSIPLDSVKPGKFIHREGSDFPLGAELVPAQTRLGSRELAVAATIGAITLEVYQRPRITIITTGDELVPPDQVPLPHQVRQSNGPALRAALQGLGIPEVRLEHLPDDEEALKEALSSVLPTTDLLLLCGGISMGKRDYVRPAMEALFGPPEFHGVRQRPGKPLAFWRGSPPTFALPGNPMSVLICFHRYVVPALARFTNRETPRLQVPLSSALDFPAPLTYFLPVTITPDLTATSNVLANSGDFASSIGSTGFLELPHDKNHFPTNFTAPYTPWL